jgi:hypothetical protein
VSIPPAPVHEGMVEQAAITTISTWIRNYLGFAEQWYDYDPEQLPDLAGPYATDSVDLERWPEQQLPCVIVHCTGLSETPRHQTDRYGATWDLRIGVIAAAADEAATRALTRAYAAAVTALLDFHGLTGLPGSTMRWMGATPEPPDRVKQRMIAGTRIDFQVDTPDALVRDDIPTVPLPDPPGGGRPDFPDAPTAETVSITVTPLEENP